VGNWRDALSSRGFAFLDGHSSVALGGELGRASAAELVVPQNRAAADPWSLSGAYGLGGFPWHTDGAISTHPPRWLLLRAVRLSQATCTKLLNPDPSLLAVLRRTVVRAADRTGRVRYLPAAVPEEGRWRLRWDPRTCTPRTGLTVEEMERQPPSATIEWHEGRLLIVDNKRLLHKRPPVDGQACRVLERTYVWDD
jgi:alpha-ketoglutarate-dependent taurine dioxygenase